MSINEISKEEYGEIIRDAIGNTKHMLDDPQCYYDYDYLKELLQILGREKIRIFCKELSPTNGTFSMCSIVSSARLAYFHFAEEKDCKFEAKLSFPLDTSWPISQPDVYKNTSDGMIFYECKCQEIFDMPHTGFSASYKTKLKNEFDIDVEVKKDKLVISKKDVGIDDEGSIYRMRVDVKQMICHLLGIANTKQKATLQYTFFVPDDKDPRRAEIKNSIENEIKKEFKQIRNSKIGTWISSTEITLAEPEFIDVSKIIDTAYKNLERKTNG